MTRFVPFRWQATRFWSQVLRPAKIASMLALGFTAGCDDSSPPPVDEARQTLVQDFVASTLTPTYDAFVTSSATLATATERYAVESSAANRELAQHAWRDAIHDWQVAELMLVGPANVATRPGGEDRRDSIYSWPLVNPCRVDQETLGTSHADTALLAAELVNVRGLFAIEYLLFDGDDNNACSAISAINAEGQWAAEQESISGRRARYAATAAALVAEEASSLRTRWDIFAAELTQTPNSTYRNTNDAVTAIADGLFYLDTITKDLKLARAAGLMGCDDDVCPELRESRYANISIAHVEANLQGFAAVFRGADGAVGFEELLQSVGGESVATEMNAAIDAALLETTLLDGSLVVLLEANPRALMPLYDAVKSITDILKSAPFLLPLQLSIPSEAAGDSD